MKYIFSLLLLVTGNTIFSQCGALLLQDNFENLSPDWTFVGTKIIHQDGKMAFNSPQGAEDQRIVRALPHTVSDSYFKTEITFTLNGPNPSGRGVTANVFALTQTTEEFMSGYSSGAWFETNNNGIALILSSDSYTDNNQSNWFFLIEDKLGTNRTWDMASKISLDPNISEYFIVFERTSAGEGQLAIYSDAAYTTHISGSPQTIEINPLISGLDYIQHGGVYSAHPDRTVNASIDDLKICENSPTGLGLTQKEEADHVHIYPNPTDGIIYFDTKSKLKSGEVMDMNGKKVLNFGEVTSLDLNGLGKGVYYLNLSMENGVSAQMKVVL